MSRWRKFRHLSGRERRLFAQSVLMLPLTALAVRVLGVGRWLSALEALAPENKSATESYDETLSGQAKATARMVKAASRHGIRRGNCLDEAIVLWWLLRRQRVKSLLRIGVRKESGELEAHAWVEFLGIALNEAESVYERFAVFDHPIVPLKADSR